MNNVKAEIWPLDFAALSKGDVIEVERIEEIARVQTGRRVRCGTEDYSLTCLALIKAIQLHRDDLRVVQDKHCVRVLADVEYASHTTRMTTHGVRKVFRAANLPQPEMDALTAAQRDAFDRAQGRALRHEGRLLESERELRAEHAILAQGKARLRA